jgi:hypothetical protein
MSDLRVQLNASGIQPLGKDSSARPNEDPTGQVLGRVALERPGGGRAWARPFRHQRQVRSSYQFWTTENRIYNASGIFGQECMVFPDQGGVVVVTGAMGDGTFHHLPEMLRETFGDAFDETTRDPTLDAAEGEAVGRWVERAREPELLRSSAHRVGFRETYDFEPNAHGLRSLSVEMRDDVVLLVLEDERGRHTIEHGIGQWIRQCTGVSVWRSTTPTRTPALPSLRPRNGRLIVTTMPRPTSCA